ncbi:phage tail protein X, partial [Chitinivorax tropicus]
PINEQYPGNAPGSYTVRGSSETLRSVAHSLWGDDAMWYLLADANGLRGSETLTPGQNLVIPNKVTNIHNNSNTFRPYNPGEAMGRIDPTMPKPPTNDNGCGTAGMILMIVVAVVATIVTAGAAAMAMGAISSTAGAGLMATGTAALMGGGGLVAVGGMAAAIGTTAVGIGAAMVGAAVGSAASQLVGMATGNVDKFSWTQVGIAALSAGVTAGVGSALGPALQSVAQGFNFSATTSHALAAGANAMIGNVITQQAMRAAGWQDGFKWNQVAAAGAGAAVGSVVGDAIGQLQYSGQGNSPAWSSVQQQLASGQGEQSFIHGFTRQLARNFASGAVSTQLTTHHYRDYQRGMLANAFGDAFANAGVNNDIATRTEAAAASRAQQLAGATLNPPRQNPFRARDGLAIDPLPRNDVSYYQDQMAGGKLPLTVGRYRVEPGESYYSIAQQHYDDGNIWPAILAANPSLASQPDHLRSGTYLDLPSYAKPPTRQPANGARSRRHRRQHGPVQASQPKRPSRQQIASPWAQN